MKKSIVAIFGIGILLYPLICFASYVIHLKDGREFVTDRYWEEGDQIKFNRYGGVIGIQKDLVKEIEEIEDDPEAKAETAKPETPSTTEKAKAGADIVVKEEGTGDKSEQEKATEETDKEDDKEGEDIDVAYYKNQKKELMARYKEAKKKLNEAILSRNKQARWEAKKELKEIHEKFAKLIREVKSANKGALPKWWHAETISK